MVTHFVTAPSFIFLLKFSCFAESAEVFFGSFRIDDAAWP